MSFDRDLWLKRIWLVNGGLLFLVMLLIIGVIVFGYVSEGSWRRPDRPVDIPEPTSVNASQQPRAVRYDAPRAIYGSPVQLVAVAYGAGYTDVVGLEGYSGMSVSRPRDPVVNIVFLDPGGQARLLLEKPAYIPRFDFPQTDRDSLQSWISYEIATEDTDRNGRLDEKDRTRLYLTDREGRGLRSVLPDGLRLLWHGPMDGGRRILVLALQEPASVSRIADDQLPEVAYVVDPSTGTAEPYAALNAVVDQIGRMLAK
jgi:hypothetical protein